jgi:o-succinylbenzoate synthase
MKIKKIKLHVIDIPMKKSFTTGFGTIVSRPTIIVKLETTEGLIGWGECPPLPFPMYKPETIDTCMIVIKKYIAPLILNKEFSTIEEFVALYSQIKGNLFAKAGVETAVWPILSQIENKSVTKLLGGTQKEIKVGISVGIGSLEETLQKIQKGLDANTHRVKLKIKPGWDVELVKQVRKKFGDIVLMVDGNSSYTLKNIETLKKLDDFDLLMIEQPLGDEDIIDHSILQKELKTPICLDESIANAEDARKAIYLKACKIINIKPGRVGGLLESKKIHDVCQKNNIGVWCGGMKESGVGKALNIAVASMSNFIYPADMSPAQLDFVDDIIEPQINILKSGKIRVPTQIGLGYAVDIEKLNKYTVEEVIINS